MTIGLWKRTFWNFSTAEERVGTVVAWAVAGFMVFLPGKIWWENTRTYAKLIEPNKAVLHQGGWFFNAKQNDLHVYRGQWHLDDGEELMVPIDGPWNDSYFIRFEDHARVYWINKSENSQTELRVVDGEWSELCDDGTWGSIFDYERYEPSGEPRSEDY